MRMINVNFAREYCISKPPWIALKNILARQLLKTGSLLVSCGINKILRYGVAIDMSASEIDNNTRASIFWGFYENAERRAIAERMLTNLPVIELGASIGFLSVLIAKRVQCKSQIAVEANPRLIPVLKCTFAENDCAHVQIVPKAIDYSGLTTVPFSVSFNSVSSHVGMSNEKNYKEVQNVETITLGQIIEQFGIEKEYVLVCDIEGAEYELIMGEGEDSKASQNCVQMIAELHSVCLQEKVLTPKEIARWICKTWKMKQVSGDGNVFVFEKVAKSNSYGLT